jgi:hypothetical protein
VTDAETPAKPATPIPPRPPAKPATPIPPRPPADDAEGTDEPRVADPWATEGSESGA